VTSVVRLTVCLALKSHHLSFGLPISQNTSHAGDGGTAQYTLNKIFYSFWCACAQIILLRDYIFPALLYVESSVSSRSNIQFPPLSGQSAPKHEPRAAVGAARLAL
jgi:hypothetical protein